MNENNKNELKIVDNVLLPDSFSLDRVELKNIQIQETNNSISEIVLCAISQNRITNKVELLYHKLNVQVSEATMKIDSQQNNTSKRKITKLDYMEYMIEKFGSRAAIHYPEKALLSLHTTYIMTDNDSHNPTILCEEIQKAIKKSLYDKEKKDFTYLHWECVVFKYDEEINEEL
eukprot:292106_1